MPPPSPRPRRADAERNRQRILSAARDSFADPRAEISMSEIARRAGVGMATLYRNFPGRRELLEALYTDEVDGICAAAATPATDAPGPSLRAWLDQVHRFFVSKGPVGAELLKDAGGVTPFFNDSRDRVLTAGRPLLAAAQRAHAVRDDLALEQILDMIGAITTVAGDPDYVQAILQTALDGLTPPAGPVTPAARGPASAARTGAGR